MMEVFELGRARDQYHSYPFISGCLLTNRWVCACKGKISMEMFVENRRIDGRVIAFISIRKRRALLTILS